MAIRL